MWIRFQPNPLGINTVDCTVRAICAVTGKSWDEIFREQCELAWERADMPSADRIWQELLRRYGFTKKRLINICPDCFTVADFAADHPTGEFVLGPHEHAVAVIDGDYYDAWDSGATIPTYYLRRE